MNKYEYMTHVDRQHLMNLKDVVAYYDVTQLRGEGNLRKIYSKQTKRDLAGSILNRYLANVFDSFVNGGLIFVFPDKNESTMIFETVNKEVVNSAVKAGKLKLLDPLASGFKSIQTTIKIKGQQAIYSYTVLLSKNFQEVIYDNLNNRVNLIGSKAVYWNDFMDVLYDDYANVNRKDLDRLILHGLRKIIFFVSKGQEVMFLNPRGNEYIYIGNSARKIKDTSKRYKVLRKKYIFKLKWHYNASKIKATHSYYMLDEENYKKHLNGELIPRLIFYKLHQECTIGKPWLRYVFKTDRKSHRFGLLVDNYDSTEDELILTKPQYEAHIN